MWRRLRTEKALFLLRALQTPKPLRVLGSLPRLECAGEFNLIVNVKQGVLRELRGCQAQTELPLSAVGR